MKYLILIFMFLTACGVNKKQWLKAEELCKNNDGVQVVYMSGESICVNGARFK